MLSKTEASNLPLWDVGKVWFRILCLPHTHTFLISRTIETGRIDPNCKATTDAAHAAGLKVDVYFFPSPAHGSANATVDQFAKGVKASGIHFNRVWLDIEPGPWGSSCVSNQRYVFDLYHRLIANGFTVGVYTNLNGWTQIMCGAKFSHAPPLWYAHYDNNPSFSDFKPFGSWTTPFAKQFAGNENHCGVSYDGNWTPNDFWIKKKHCKLRKMEIGRKEKRTLKKKRLQGAQYVLSTWTFSWTFYSWNAHRGCNQIPPSLNFLLLFFFFFLFSSLRWQIVC